MLKGRKEANMGAIVGEDMKIVYLQALVTKEQAGSRTLSGPSSSSHFPGHTAGIYQVSKLGFNPFMYEFNLSLLFDPDSRLSTCGLGVSSLSQSAPSRSWWHSRLGEKKSRLFKGVRHGIEERRVSTHEFQPGRSFTGEFKSGRPPI